MTLAGKAIVVTGASSGIGACAAAKFTALGAQVAVVGRSPEKTVEVAQRSGGEPFVADFSRLDEVRRLAEQLRNRFDRIDILANNAGGAWPRRTFTVDGNETTFQVNHLGPFLLTSLLFDRLAPDARVINTSSTTYRLSQLNLDTVNSDTGFYNGLSAYGASKLATILFTRELAKRTAGTGLVTAAFHPGSVATGVYRNVPFGGAVVRSPLSRLFFITPDKGAEPLVHLATTSDTDAINGQYFHRLKLEPPRNAQGTDAELAARLWDLSEQLTGVSVFPAL